MRPAVRGSRASGPPRGVVAISLVVMFASTAFAARGAQASTQTVVRPGVMVPILATKHHGAFKSSAARVAAKPAPRVAAASPISTFQVNYTGFSAPAKAAFQAAVDYWAATVSSTVPITIDATFADLGDEDENGLILGQAGTNAVISDFPNAPVAHTLYPSALANRLAGKDLVPDDVDISADFTSNAAASWYFGTDNLPGDAQLDFESVVLHELGHGLGFFGSMAVNSAGVGGWGYGLGYPTIYDRFAMKANTSLLSFPNNSKALGNQIVSGDIAFKGPATQKAKLFAPKPYQPGSSYSHLDEDTYPEGNPNALMTPRIGYGEGIAAAGPIALNMFRDMGWSIPDRSATHDLTNDGNNDLIAKTSAGVLSINPGNGAGGFLPAEAGGITVNALSKVLITPDWNGDGKADLIARTPDGRVLLYPFGNGSTAAVQMATGWKTFTAVVTPGDFNRDGKADLIARTADGKLLLYRGNGAKGFIAPPVQIGTGWKGFTALVGPGDFNGDGRPDVIARTADGKLKLFRGNGANGFLAPAVQIGTGTKNFTALVGPGDFNGDGLPDLIARTPDGKLQLLRGNGSTALLPALQIAAGYNGLALG